MSDFVASSSTSSVSPSPPSGPSLRVDSSQAASGSGSSRPSWSIAEADVQRLIHADHDDPFAVLGPHEAHLDGVPGWVVRAFLPTAREATVVLTTSPAPYQGPFEFPMTRVHPDGVYEVAFAGLEGRPRYRIRATDAEGRSWSQVDPYQFGRVLTDYDLYLLGEGTHYKNYEKMGAHIMEHEGVHGVHFAVWAPNARRVSVVGDFNQWDGRRLPMRRCGPTGIWEIFVPGLVQGDLYKFEIQSQFHGYLVEKSDPYGFYAEVRPKTASVVWDITRFQWNDQDWMAQRSEIQGLDRPISIYELHLGSWKRKVEEGGGFLTYRELADQLAEYLKEMGFTHIELMPITEHPFDGSWGYQTVGYFAPTSRHGTPDDFAYFVDKMHQAGIGVILDWVPAHFPRDLHGLGYFDGTHLYEHADPRLGEHRDWNTKIFNFGRNEVRNFLLGSALFWLERYHIDGLRVDAVASMLYLDYSRQPGEWLPNRFGGNENLEAIDFLKRLNELCHGHHPGILTFAEESTSWPGVSRPTYLGGLGFSLKWNMGWMNDTLSYFAKDPIHRKYHHGMLTFSLIYAFHENFVLPLSHDEVVHGKGSILDKMPGDLWQKFANVRLLYAYMFAHPGKKLLFMGNEIAQWREWSHAESLDWHLLEWASHRGVQTLVRDLNRLYRSLPALHEVDFDWRGFEWLELHDADNSVLAFLRRGRDPDDIVVCVCNFTPVPRHHYRVGVPSGGFYEEILNTDAALYGGGNVGNAGGVEAEFGEHAGRPFHLTITVPPLATVYFRIRRG